MSTSNSISEINELRQSAVMTNQSLRTLNNLTGDGNMGLRDVLVLTRILTGGNEDLASLIGTVQTVIAVVTTARAALKLLQIEMGPLGWAFLIAGTVIGPIVVDQMSQRPRY